MNSKILFIGGGNIARAIITGLAINKYHADDLFVVDRNESKRNFFKEKFNIHTSELINTFLPIADIIFLAVKPQDAKKVCDLLKANLKDQNPVIVSLMAGVTTNKLSQWMGAHLPIVRAAPNTPALIQLGATGLFANPRTTQKQKEAVGIIMSSVGVTGWLHREDDMNVITALSGSGPAYYFYFMEIMERAAIKMGIPADIAREFSLQTAYGASKLALKSEESLEQLRAQVTSKRGTTEAAIEMMQKQGIEAILENALNSARNRAWELGEELDV